MPTSVQFTAPLKGLFEDMLSRSDRFRSQCERLATQPWVYVRVRLAEGPLPYAFQGRTMISRTLDGPIIAYIEIDARASWHEWIAHEIEHVLEQAEGLRRHDLVGQRDSWETAESTFETKRALDAGRIVSQQMRQLRRRQGAAAE
jgi:hypothetical protein